MEMRYACVTIILLLSVVLASIGNGSGSENANASVSGNEDSVENVLFDKGRCILPLGMEEGKIPDNAITASSSYESKSVGPQNARIRQEKNGGAWCPKAQISSAIREYLEVDLTRDHLIAWTETQGRFGNGQGQEYAEAFFLEYWRDAKWHQYKNLRGEKVLRGNSNTYLVEKQKLDLPFVASRVRFVPYSQHPRTVCMRVEIYGCIWDQYVTSYSVDKASSPGPEGADVQDSSYDGVEDIDSVLANGLGQLTDGILGRVSEILSETTSEKSDRRRGTNWVGWSERATVQILFKFRELRRFENCSVHVARIPRLEVETFSTLRISFSVDDSENQPGSESKAVQSEFSPPSTIDADSATAMSISIPLHGKLGRSVKLEFIPAAKWLLLSEITFYTGEGNRLRNDTDDSVVYADRDENEWRSKSMGSFDSIVDGFNGTEMYETREIRNSTPSQPPSPDAFPVGSSQTYIGLVSGLLTVLAFFFTCLVFLLKQRGRNKIALLQKHTALLCDTSTSGIAISSKPNSVKLSDSIVNGLTLIRKPIAVAVFDRSPANRPNEIPSAGTAIIADPPVVQDVPRRSSGPYEENTYDDPFSRPSNPSTVCVRTPDPRPALKYNFATPYSTSKKAFQPRSRVAATTIPATTTKNQKIRAEGYYAATDILTIKTRESQSSSSPFTTLYVRDKAARLPRTTDSCNVQRVSRHRLRILDKLGEGNFGLIHLCEAKGIVDPEMGTIQNRRTVLVRSLWRGVVDSLRFDFTKDMHALSTLRNRNVAKMMALVEEEPFGAIFEYGQFGDLPNFLENPKIGMSKAEGKEISFSLRLSFIIQIASGMRYLESMNVAHCDLAARNCIVDRNLTIKVSDHATYCTKYDHHYLIDGQNVKIPLRWMAWEAALLGTRSCRTDIWSFGVTVWEIFRNCAEIPYADLTETQVMENHGRWFRGDDGPRILERPDICPEHLYSAITKCWSKRAEDRPSFEEIYLYLEKLSHDLD
ncbi:discoidin domain-containing receptor tyrosine kinase B-like [Ceratina calcarata]|uniref:Discoidin domain-containing receptor tyrosine kinase B-like n=1 Tax=Ceratina calcarata TaxID=156304 RepID=A0AAJ7S620_9HYME|nr:discoidin domain-containing receptor tyrosine kinase B-like [Ceratina calcarata]XP_026671589.1 discoidin domain-containing receptor tyrosine kinase B-like [Ceratina calcarata]